MEVMAEQDGGSGAEADEVRSCSPHGNSNRCDRPAQSLLML